VDRPVDYCGSDIGPPDYKIKHAGTRPSAVLPRENHGSLSGTMHQVGLWRGQKGKERLQGSLYPGWHNVPRLPTHSWQYCKKESPHIGHQVRGGPRKKMRGGNAYELGMLPRQ
jgi:hypothetical protein